MRGKSFGAVNRRMRQITFIQTRLLCIKVIPIEAQGPKQRTPDVWDCSTIGASFCLSFFLCHLYLVYPAECLEVPCKLCEKLRACCDWQPYHNVFTTPNRVFPRNRDAFAVAERQQWEPNPQIFNMSKRPPDSTSSLTSPHLKHARMESPLETEREQALRDAHAKLSTLITKKNHILHIYYQLHQIDLDNKVLTRIKDQPLLTVDQVQINAESVNQEQFLEILRKAVKSPLDHEAVETLIFHGMCFTLGWIRS